MYFHGSYYKQCYNFSVSTPRFIIAAMYMHFQGFPDGASGKEPPCQCRRHQRHRFDPWVREILWRRAWQPTPVFLPEEFHGQRSLESYSPQGGKELDTTEATEHA